MIRSIESEKMPIKILVYGKSGTGKTYSLSTLPPSYRPAIVFNIENKLAPIAGQPGIYTTDLITDASSLKAAVQELRDYEEQNKVHFPTVVIDSFTLLQLRLAEAYESLRSNERNRMAYYEKVLQVTMRCVDYLLLEFRDRLVIFTALEDVEGLSGEYSGQISLLGKARALVASRFDTVIYSFIEKGGYYWRLRSDTQPLKTHSPIEEEVIPQDYALLLKSLPVAEEAKGKEDTNDEDQGL